MGVSKPSRLAMAFAVGLAGGAAAAIATSPAAAADGPWWIYREAGAAENRGAWSNIIPANGAEGLRIDLADRSGAAAGATAVRLDFDFVRVPWSGIIVASAPGYWGDRPGPGFDFSGARALVFRARGQSGGESIRVKAAVAGDQADGDSALLPLDSGWITLSADWREYRIDSDGRDLRRVVTPFMVIANDKHNPSGRAVVFLDDIRWERGG